MNDLHRAAFNLEQAIFQFRAWSKNGINTDDRQGGGAFEAERIVLLRNIEAAQGVLRRHSDKPAFDALIEIEGALDDLGCVVDTKTLQDFLCKHLDSLEAGRRAIQVMADCAVEEPAKETSTTTEKPLPLKQRQVLDLLKGLPPGEGLTAKQIAVEIGDTDLGESVKNTIARLRKKGYRIPSVSGAGYFLENN